GGEGGQDLGGEVRGVGVVEPVLEGEAVDQGRVQLHELRPRLPVARVADAGQQAGASANRVGHARSSALPYRPSRDNLSRIRAGGGQTVWPAIREGPPPGRRGASRRAAKAQRRSREARRG